MSYYNRVEINLACLKGNYEAIQKKVGSEVKILAIVKADAYGHGLLEVVQTLTASGGRLFGVAEIEEGIRLREANIPGDIVVLLGSSDYREIIQYKLSPVVFDLTNIRCLSEYAVKLEKQVGVHLKIDVGMGRLGVMPEQVSAFIQLIEDLPGVFLAGVMGHFPVADDQTRSIQTSEQCRKFIDLTVGRSNRHIANSAALINYPASLLHIVRPGISLYGCYPSESLVCRQQIPLRPVMSFKSRIIQVKEVPAGYGVSYGHLFVTKRPSRLAVIPVGYADGYLRGLTGQAEVLVRGQRAPVCGRICMNASLVDVTDVEGSQVGDEVVLMGSQDVSGSEEGGQAISVDDIARWLGTINYEVLCLLGCNNKRVYL